MQYSVRQMKNGIVYDSDTADLIHYKEYPFTSGMFDFLGVTPDGNYFLARVGFPRLGGLIIGSRDVFPCSRLSAIEWAIREKAPVNAFERLGVTIMPEPDVPADKPYEALRNCGLLHVGVKRFINPLIHSTAEVLLKNPDGRFFLRKYTIRLRRFLSQKDRPMSQLKALRWAVLNDDASLETLEMLGYIRNYEHKGEGNGLYSNAQNGIFIHIHR